MHGEVLDVGCGAQPYRELFSPESHIQGIDHEAVRDTFGYEESDVRYYTGDTWPADSGSASAAFASRRVDSCSVGAMQCSAALGGIAGGRPSRERAQRPRRLLLTEAKQSPRPAFW